MLRLTLVIPEDLVYIGLESMKQGRLPMRFRQDQFDSIETAVMPAPLTILRRHCPDMLDQSSPAGVEGGVLRHD